jgi:K+-transporting ATPase ATPase A chain
MRWPRYALAVLLFNLLGVLVVYGLERAQGSLPLNPAGWAGVPPEVSFNTAVSFASNTNWQSLRRRDDALSTSRRCWA